MLGQLEVVVNSYEAKALAGRSLTVEQALADEGHVLLEPVPKQYNHCLLKETIGDGNVFLPEWHSETPKLSGKSGPAKFITTAHGRDARQAIQRMNLSDMIANQTISFAEQLVREGAICVGMDTYRDGDGRGYYLARIDQPLLGVNGQVNILPLWDCYSGTVGDYVALSNVG